MKKIILALIALSLFASARLSAQYAFTAEYTVPFAFSVSDTVLPAGTYRAAPCSISPNVIQLRSYDQLQSVMFLVLPNQQDPEYPGKLVFNRYGQQYFLSEVHAPFISTSARLPVSDSEQRARLENATVRTWEEITIPNEKQ